MKTKLTGGQAALAAITILGVTACGGGSNDDAAPPPAPAPAPTPQVSFDITVTNLTNAQPLSPIAAIAHDGVFRVFELGAPSSVPLEELAEGGDNTAFVDAASTDDAVFATTSGEGPIPPGGSETVAFSTDETNLTTLSVSLVTMLVNTNDAFTALNSLDVSAMEIGDVRMLRTISYDAGTEAESEAAGTIPGPAVGGEGFNPERDDDADRVSMHAGVLTPLDGLETSVLTDQHRFDNPVASVRIERTN